MHLQLSPLNYPPPNLSDLTLGAPAPTATLGYAYGQKIVHQNAAIGRVDRPQMGVEGK